MLSEIDHFYLRQQEPTKSCLLALKKIILSSDSNISHVWKYKLPFFCYKGKMLCYTHFHKEFKKPYLGFYNGSLLHSEDLLAENRTRVKIFLIDADQDLPIEKINDILKQATRLYHTMK